MVVKARNNRTPSFPASVQDFESHVVYEEKPKYDPQRRICPETRAKLFAGVLTLLALLFLKTAWHHHDSYPRDLVVVGKRTYYQHVPLQFRKRFYIDDDNNFRRTVIRAFRNRGWKKANEPEEAQFVYDKYAWTPRFNQLLPWQRYSHYPGTVAIYCI